MHPKHQPPLFLKTFTRLPKTSSAASWLNENPVGFFFLSLFPVLTSAYLMCRGEQVHSATVAGMSSPQSPSY